MTFTYVRGNPDNLVAGSAASMGDIQGPLYDLRDYLNTLTFATYAPPISATLPVAPVDGQEVYYLADSTTGAVWHLRYRLGSASPYRWEFLGGDALLMESAASWAVASPGVPGVEQAASSLVPPLAGDYEVDFGGSLSASAAVIDVIVKARSSPVAGGPSSGTVSSALAQFDLATGTLLYVARSSRLLAIPAGQAVYWNFYRLPATTTTITTTNRYLRLRPLRVG